MILVWGALDDPPVERVLESLAARTAEVVHLDDHSLGGLRYDIRLGPRPRGWIEVEGRRIEVDELSGMYLRPGEQQGPAAAASATMLAVAGSVAATVVNRPAAGRSNLSKPFQLAVLADAGLPTPETLVTSDADAARAFLGRHGRIVYKSISGRRSIVASVGIDEIERLDQVGHGPVQLQRWVEGIDVRVHVVGDRWFATSVASTATDYRYAGEQGLAVALAPFDLPDELGRHLVEVTAAMGLAVAGVDLRRTPDGGWCCFEVNPSPGFPYYEDHTGQPIAAAIADLLTTSPRRADRSVSRRGRAAPGA